MEKKRNIIGFVLHKCSYKIEYLYVYFFILFILYVFIDEQRYRKQIVATKLLYIFILIIDFKQF